MEPWRHHDVIPLKIFIKSQIFIFWILFFEIRSKTPLTGPPKSENRTFWKKLQLWPPVMTSSMGENWPQPPKFLYLPKMTTSAKYGVSRTPFAFLRRKSVKELKNFSKQAEFGRLWCQNRRHQKIHICQLVIVTKYQSPTINALDAVAKSP